MGSADGADMTTDAVQRGFYHRALTGWLECFDRDQLLILQYATMHRRPGRPAAVHFSLPGVNRLHTPTSDDAPPMASPVEVGLDADVRSRLIAVYQSDVLALANAVPAIDLSLWPNFSYLGGRDALGLVPVPPPDGRNGDPHPFDPGHRATGPAQWQTVPANCVPVGDGVRNRPTARRTTRVCRDGGSARRNSSTVIVSPP